MMSLPNEILLNIFSHLSQRHLRYCPLVCRAWHHVAQPLLYDTVEFCSRQQLETFIEARRWIYTTSGNSIREIGVCSDIRLDNAILISLQKACPNVESLVYPNFVQTVSSVIRPWLFDKWKSLTTLTVSVRKDRATRWHSKAGQLTQLNVKLSHNRPYTVLNILPRRLPSLVQLSIDFDYSNSVYPDNTLFDYLASSCPSLTTLTLTSLYYYQENLPSSDEVWTQVNSVMTLNLRVSEHYDYRRMTHFFDAYTNAFPNLACLNLCMEPKKQYTTQIVDSSYDIHRMAVYNFITSFKHLKSLRVSVFDQSLLTTVLIPRYHLLPTVMITDWLANSGLTSLDWPGFSLFNPNAELNRHIWLAQLTCLTVLIHRDLTITDLLRSLLFDNTRSTIPDQLVSLNVNSVESRNYAEFDLSAWAKASPRLEELTIKRFKLVSDRSDDNIKACHFDRLESLIIHAVGIDAKNGFTRLASHCPILKRFHCMGKVCIYGMSSKLREKNILLDMKASHWELDSFYLSRQFCHYYRISMFGASVILYEIRLLILKEGDDSKERVLRFGLSTSGCVRSSNRRSQNRSAAFALRIKSAGRLVFGSENHSETDVGERE